MGPTSLLSAHPKPWHRGRRTPTPAIKQEVKPRDGQPPAQGTHTASHSLSRGVRGLSPIWPPSDRASCTHQDEETLIGKFLVLLDSGQHGQHQAGEHQQKSAKAARREGLDCWAGRTAKEPRRGAVESEEEGCIVREAHLQSRLRVWDRSSLESWLVLKGEGRSPQALDAGCSSERWPLISERQVDLDWPRVPPSGTPPGSAIHNLSPWLRGCLERRAPEIGGAEREGQ